MQGDNWMISSFNIQNFKCFKSQDLKLGKLTILSGANGVGKSTVVQSLLLLRETWDKIQGILPDATSSKPNLSIPVSLNGPYSLCLGNTRNITNSELESNLLSLSTTTKNGETYRFDFEVDTESHRTTIDYRAKVERAEDIHARFMGSSLFENELHYLTAERVGPRDLYGTSDQRFINTGFSGEYTAQAIAQSSNRQISEHLCLVKGTQLFRLQLEAWLDQITPGIQISTFEYPEVNRVRVGLRKGTDTNWLSPSNIGFGISYTLPIIVSGLLAPAGSMLIVENPEAHLHPAAQSAMGRFITRVAFSGVQVVVETHSEHVVNGARLEALSHPAFTSDVQFLFFSTKDQEAQPEITSITMDGRGELSSWPLGFFDQQTKDLGDLLRAKRGKPQS